MLRDIIERILTEWPTAIKEQFTGHPIANAIRKDLSEKVKSIIEEHYPTYIVSGSAGAGNWANVPWLSILNPTITKTTQDGIYPGYLFRPDGNGVYLSIGRGSTNPQKLYGKVEADRQADQLVADIRSKLPLLAEWGNQEVDLDASTPLGKSYEKSNIAARFYPLNSLPTEQELIDDLLAAMKFYNDIEPIWRATKSESTINLLSNFTDKIVLPKPFLLLAGISGTGKTRFVREQAAAHNKGNSNYCLIPVRPDWHEPSDLLGYISRIGLEGPCYVVTKLLVFIVAAWQNAFFSVEENKLICKHAAEMTPYWLCLDEMNLAPVEQYFADYLSVLETRKWENEEYSCDPLLVSDTIKLLKPDKPDIGQEKLRKDLKLIGEENDALWAYFLNNGISIPPNLIVAGTVNMDETTHGFSRKVIDRAFTIDFGVFYPNDYGHYFESPIRHKTLSFPLLSQVSQEDLSVVSADTDGQNSIDFLTAINTVLKGTPFELAYRALNELLLAVVSFAPKDDLELQAVWDDFLMSKVLPRIDGDTEKLSNSVDDNSSDILSALLDVIDISFKEILIKNQRLDLLRENKDEKEKNKKT